MPNSVAEAIKRYYKLNVSTDGNYTFSPVLVDPKVELSDKPNIQPEPDKADFELKFEDFEGKSVHLYALRYQDSTLAKEFKWNDAEGQEQIIKANGTELICVLDFRNTSDRAISNWQVSFKSPGLSIRNTDLVNAKLTMQGDRFILSSVEANSRIPAGGTLSHKIIFKPTASTVPIAYDFKLESGVPGTLSPDIDIPKSTGKFDYNQALALSLYGFTWQISGKKPVWSTNPHRGDSFLDDGLIDAKRDLSGGVHDAGDAIKVAFAAAGNNAQYAFTGIFYKEVYQKLNQWEMLKNIVKHYSDWFIKCHEMEGDRTIRFWHWVSNNRDIDHQISLPPERQPEEYKKRGKYRRSYAIDANNRGEEPLCMVAASHALTALMLKNDDPQYGAELIRRSRSLFGFAEQYRGKYTPQTVYASNSYGDEICFAAICLYFATKEDQYLDKAKRYYNAHINYPGWTWLVDNCTSACTFLLAYLTKEDRYLSAVKSWSQSWLDGKNGVRKHSTGILRSNSDWGSIPQFSSALGLMVFANDFIPGMQNSNYLNLAKAGLDYVLGDNSKGFSYLIGFGNNYPKHPHHRSVYNGADVNKPAPLIGKGLLVAGEKVNGFYQDSYMDWVTNECGCYNSAFQMLVTAVAAHY